MSVRYELVARWPLFDMAQAPNARGLFLGDYQGLVTVGNDFVPLLALSGTDLNNRTDVFTLRTAPATSTSPRHDTTQDSTARALSASDVRARITAYTRTLMEARMPGWGQRVGLGSTATGDTGLRTADVEAPANQIRR